MSTPFFRWGNLRKAASQELQFLPDLTGMGRNSWSGASERMPVRCPQQDASDFIAAWLGMKAAEAGFGGGQSFFFFAEGEADLCGAVLRVVVEAGAGDAGDADLFDEIAGEADIGGFGGGAIFCAGSLRREVSVMM